MSQVILPTGRSKMPSGHSKIAKAQIRISRCAVWSGPSLSAARIIGYYRMYQWSKGVRRICTCPGWCEFAQSLHARRHFFTWHNPYYVNILGIYSTHLYFYLMSFLSIFHLSIFVSQFCLFFLQLSLCDLPECVHFISLKLEIVPLFSFSIQLFTQSHDVLFQLERKTEQYLN